jgi:L-histidine N-alpha-methyltransferase
MNKFFLDVFKGLSAPLKHLDSKYFYDETGDRLFQEIMDCPEYYLTKCELEILSKQSHSIIDFMLSRHESFDVVELGAGNALKSGYFLRELIHKNVPFTYYPIDISFNVISLLEKELPEAIPRLKMHTLCGEYIEMLKKASALSDRPKVILFLGSNIGNFSPESAAQFFIEIKRHLNPGDMLLTGFDLKKDPRVILNAYNDKAGITRQFNLNLLHRINRELEADFKTSQFDHFPTYDPQTGACKSYLVSLQDQVVRIGEADFITFREGEPISTEISQKYSLDEIEGMADQGGYKLMNNFFDSRNWFVDSLWESRDQN